LHMCDSCATDVCLEKEHAKIIFEFRPKEISSLDLAKQIIIINLLRYQVLSQNKVSFENLNLILIT
jgi:hypothetical protein